MLQWDTGRNPVAYIGRVPGACSEAMDEYSVRIPASIPEDGVFASPECSMPVGQRLWELVAWVMGWRGATFEDAEEATDGLG
jgi:hypothetical protein